MQGGDFMLSTNILLSGNNFTKVALLFRFMNMGMVVPATFYAVQDMYCVEAVKDFWEEKRATVIERLHTKDGVGAPADGRMDSPDPEKGRYKDFGVIHSLDIWHAAKNLTKKLHAAGIISGQSDIHVWLKDIVNHFWFCCQKADNREEFMGMWRGVLHHVTGVHEWGLGRCQHEPLPAASHGKDCMLSGSAAHEALSKIVLNRRWLKDVEKFLTFRQKRVYNKKSKRYRVTTVKVAKDYSYIPQLQQNILGKRLKAVGGLPRRRSMRPDDPRTLGVLAGVVPPTTAELVQAQIRRGQDMTSET
ncbi:uncharacterized protein LOC119494253 [Sebastes umbrosus]|uniref:uncharacterized protein LOC119494253 n=1 Tax=Sebastes umbrosus TaxID=72105 RepID=UPI00189CA5E2|nr:uncharacterized protein LOC119494253 [Sebastes umbrosus]